MFKTKRKAEVVTKSVTRGEVNAFLNNAKAEGNITRSGNGAKKYSSSGDTFTDQFTKAGSYKSPRAYDQIAQDCELLWGEDPLKCVKFILFLRTIPRTVNLPDGSKTEAPQKGTELKHEAIMRMIWLHTKAPKAFWNNILLFVSLGSWHDIFTMLQYDLSYNGWNDRKLDWDNFGDLILAGLENDNTRDLVKKYLPQIKARKQATTIDAQSNNSIGKWLCSLLFGTKTPEASTYKRYRKLKTSGTAHYWQKLISQGRFKEIEFNKIHGRALSILVKGKFLKNQGLSDDYSKWISNPETKDVKYTGFVHELFQPLDSGCGYGYSYGRKTTKTVDANTKATINKQFDTLVNKAKDGDSFTDLIVVRDTSGSMGSTATGTNMSCYSIAKAIALYFNSFLTGTFSDHWIEFNSSAKLQKWVGQDAVAKWENDKSAYVGGTNFQSVINLFCTMLKQGTPEADFPSGILCISDGEFNPAQLCKTNVETAKSALRSAGFSKAYVDNFVIVLWNLQSYAYGGAGDKFETGKDTQNVFYFGGYSASVVSFLSNKIKTTYDLMDEALEQEVLSMVKI